LFGHERGAFTGAIAQKVGRFELAHKGTLFLDEVGDIPLELQPKLLRVLQEQEFERLGSTRTQRVDVRVLAATNASLTQMVAEKKFRSDLYYRLKVFPIDVPPLRDRREDIPLLVRHFSNKYARRMGKQIESIPKEAMDALSHYTWPGNIRELQNLMERATLLSTGPSLRVPLAEILNDSGSARLAAAMCWSRPGESRLCEHSATAIGLSEVLVERQLAWASRGRRSPTRCRSWGSLAHRSDGRLASATNLYLPTSRPEYRCPIIPLA
jgi:transcriptional regulator with GAF, ATPase, and Fis domain